MLLSKFLFVLMFVFAPVQVIAAPPLKYHLGAGYIQYSEAMQISEGSSISKGIANYAGPSLAFEVSQMFARSQFGINLLASSGKAAAGAFDGDVTFDDAINRGWWAMQISPYGNFRLTSDFQVGAGPLIKVRVADWEPANTNLNVQTSSAYSFGFQIGLHLEVARRLSLRQYFGILDFEGNNQWLVMACYQL